MPDGYDTMAGERGVNEVPVFVCPCENSCHQPYVEGLSAGVHNGTDSVGSFRHAGV
jgi:hypothetical protein